MTEFLSWLYWHCILDMHISNMQCLLGVLLCNNGWCCNVKVKWEPAGCTQQRAHVQQGLSRRGARGVRDGVCARAQCNPSRIVRAARVTLHRFTFHLARNRLCAFLSDFRCAGTGRRGAAPGGSFFSAPPSTRLHTARRRVASSSALSPPPRALAELSLHSV